MYQMQCSLSLLSLYILCFKKVDANFVTCVSTNYCTIWHNWNLISCIKINQPLHFVLTHIPFYIREKNNTFHLQPEFYHHGLYAYSTAYHPHTGFPHLVFLNKLALKVVKLCVAYPHAFFFTNIDTFPSANGSQVRYQAMLCWNFCVLTNDIAFNLIPYLSIQMLLVAEIHPAGRHAFTCYK